MKISICSTVTSHGQKRWLLSYKPSGGRRVRKYFSSKSDAEAERDDVREQQNRAGEVWLSMAAHERNALISANADARRFGFSLTDAVDYYKLHRAALGNSPLQDLFVRFLSEKTAEKLSKRSLAALKSNVGRFIYPHREKAAAMITRSDAMTWLAHFSDSRTFNSYLTSLNTFLQGRGLS